MAMVGACVVTVKFFDLCTFLKIHKIKYWKQHVSIFSLCMKWLKRMHVRRKEEKKVIKKQQPGGHYFCTYLISMVHACPVSSESLSDCCVLWPKPQTPSVHGIFETRILKWVALPPRCFLTPGMEPASPTLLEDSLPLHHQEALVFLSSLHMILSHI